MALDTQYTEKIDFEFKQSKHKGSMMVTDKFNLSVPKQARIENNSIPQNIFTECGLYIYIYILCVIYILWVFIYNI